MRGTLIVRRKPRYGRSVIGETVTATMTISTSQPVARHSKRNRRLEIGIKLFRQARELQIWHIAIAEPISATTLSQSSFSLNTVSHKVNPLDGAETAIAPVGQRSRAFDKHEGMDKILLWKRCRMLLCRGGRYVGRLLHFSNPRLSFFSGSERCFHARQDDLR